MNNIILFLLVLLVFPFNAYSNVNTIYLSSGDFEEYNRSCYFLCNAFDADYDGENIRYQDISTSSDVYEKNKDSHRMHCAVINDEELFLSYLDCYMEKVDCYCIDGDNEELIIYEYDGSYTMNIYMKIEIDLKTVK